MPSSIPRRCSSSTSAIERARSPSHDEEPITPRRSHARIRSCRSRLLAAAALLARATAQAQVKLRYAHVGVANAPQTLYADEVAKLVKERTNGRVEIQVFPNSQLGGVGELVDGVKSGAISMGHHDFASLGKIVSDTAVFNTPFVYRDPGTACARPTRGRRPRCARSTSSWSRRATCASSAASSRARAS